MKRLATIAACFATACASYEEPAGAATTLVIEQSAVDPAAVYTFVDSERCSGRRAVHEGISAGNPARIKVEANRPFTIGVVGQRPLPGRNSPLSRGLSNCTAVVTFIPAAGTQYVARYEYRGEACRLGILQRPATAAIGTQPAFERTQRLRTEPACR